MQKLKLEFPEHFFEGEERCDYFISPEMKKVWAVELDLLNELMSVLDKYGIKYFAGGGTMLGAVRHQGMIPWDDDIDIFMKRSEYEKFVKIARSGEFKEPYFWQDHITDPNYLGGPSRLHNSETTAMGRYFLNEKHGTLAENMGIYVDVFPLDNIPDDEEEREQWLERISKVARMAWDLRLYTHRGLLRERKDLEWLDFWLKLTNRPNHLFEEYDSLLSDNAEEKTEKCTIYSFYCRSRFNTTFLYENNDLENFVKKPFEMLEVPVPSLYDKILTQTYGNWHQFVRSGSVHERDGNSLCFDTDHPYTFYLDPITGIKKELVRKMLFK
jgi:lipopolysaccharide cholinephosphotransferase